MSCQSHILRRVIGLPAKGLIGLVRLYQLTLSPLIGGQCRYHPTCSAYFIESVRKKGFWIGSGKGIRRILRCHPLARGGYDPVEKVDASGLGKAPQPSGGQQGGGDVDDAA